MPGALVFLLTSGALLTTGGLAAASLRLRSLTAFVLAAYVIAWAELVAIVAVLSPAQLVLRWTLVTSVATLLLVAFVVWTLLGQPAAPSLQPALQCVRALLREPAIAMLAGVVALGFCYLLALSLFTPPNSIDALWYHLPRAAIWLQHHGVGYIPDVNDARLNGNPPVAEIGFLFTMAVSGADRFVTLVSLGAYCALPLVVFGLARRVGAEARVAVCAGLAFATLPVLILQAPSAKNDLVLASFACICVYFSMGMRAAEYALAGMALALALATKIFSPLVIPMIALVVLAVGRRRHAFALAAVAVPAVVLGETWNIVNLAQTGSLLGDLSDGGGDRAVGAVDFVAVTARYLIDFAEVPGAAGWRFAAYVVAALVLAALLLRRRESGRPLVVALLLVTLPALALAIGSGGARAYRYVLFDHGHPDLGNLDYARSLSLADPMFSYFGPLGIALLLAVFIVVAERQNVPRVTLVFAAAPILFVLGIAVPVGYSTTSGRFYVFPVALAAAASARFLSSRPVLWAVVAVSVPTAGLTLWGNVEKPPSIWGEPRWRVQTLIGPHNEQVRLIRFSAESLPRHARVGLSLRDTDMSYPFFDAHLQRRVRFVSPTGDPPADVSWLVVAPSRPPAYGGWRVVIRTPGGGWRLYKRR